jgi:hypothetical protein
MRQVAIVALASTLAASLVTPAAAADRFETARYRTKTYRFDRWSREEVKWTIRAAEDAMPVPGGLSKALDVARCESGLYARARSASGTYLGVYQHAKHYWDGRVAAYRRAHGGALDIRAGAGPYSARANVLVTMWMAHRDGWSHWTCA